MTVLALSLLGAGIVGSAARPKSIPSWVAPLVAATAALLLGFIDTGRLIETLDSLAEPLAFLVLAIPLAVLLDRAGTFTTAAGLGGS